MGKAYDYDYSGFKTIRLAYIKEHRARCEICGRRGNMLIHQDGDVANHEKSNLMLLCAKCWGLIETGRDKKSKFIGAYGLTIAQIHDQTGISIGAVTTLHRAGVLKSFLQQELRCFNCPIIVERRHRAKKIFQKREKNLASL